MITDTHHITLMDLLIINPCITHSIRDLSGLHMFDCLKHSLSILRTVLLGHITDHGSNSLRNGLSRHNHDLFILSKIPCLVCSKNNILIVRENINSLCIYFCNGIEHILCTRVHCLTALDQVIHTQFLKDLCHSLSHRYGNKANFLRRLCCFFFFFLFCLFFRHFLGILYKLLLMLLTHIVDLHT